MTSIAGERSAAQARLSESPPTKSKYRPEIDGLRAFAVVAVIINHFNKDLLPSGYLGVDIFFVISGYVITSSLANHQRESFRDFFLGFYERRIKRLVPALVLYVLIISLLICLFNPTPESALKIGITSSIGLSNIHLFKKSTDYFAQSTELIPFSHTWSLGVEEQFYLLFPVLIWFSGFGRERTNGNKNLSWSVGLLSIASLTGFIYFYPINQSATYFLMPPRFWELGIGCLVFLTLQKRVWISEQLGRVPSLPIVALMIGTLFLPLSSAVPATISIVFLSGTLICALREGKIIFKIFTFDKFIYIGLISYSLYLWHWGVLSISRWTIGIHLWTAPFQIALMVLLAVASYKFVETPLRTAQWSQAKWKSIAYGLGASFGLALLIALAGKLSSAFGFSLFTGRRPHLIAEGASTLTNPYSVNGSTWEGEKCVLSNNSQAGKDIPVMGCTLGDFTNASHRVLVIGNSFSVTFTQGFDKLILRDNFAVLITSAFGGSPIDNFADGRGAMGKADQYYWKNVIPGLVAKLKKGDWVFMVNDLSGFSPKSRSPESELALSTLERGLQEFSDQLSSKGISILFLNGLPLAREAVCNPASASRQWFNHYSENCEFPNKKVSLMRRQDLDNTLQKLQANGKIKIIDLFPIFCPQPKCTYNSLSGQFLYRDEFSHPSVEAARLSSDEIRKAFLAR